MTDVRQELATSLGPEAAPAVRVRSAVEILAAADERDALADARDLTADSRERDLDLARFLAVDADYGRNWPERRAAALDRERSKQDRAAARRDRLSLARPEVPTWPA